MNKSFLFSALTLLMMTKAYTQPITITGDDMPHAGTLITYQAIDSFNLNVGLAGNNQIWDFSNVAGGNIATIIYDEPGGYAGYELFPGATLVEINSAHSKYYYYEINSQHNFLLGIYDTLYMDPYIYSVPKILLSLPAEYNNSFNGIALTLPESTVYPGCDSAKHKFYEIYSYDIDGWGTVITPWGTYQCLRQEFYVTGYDSLNCYQSGNLNITNKQMGPTINHYYWWAKGIEHPVVSHIYYPISMSEYRYFTRIYIGSSAGTAKRIYSPLLRVAPNPGKNEIRFEFKAENISKIKIIDGTGKGISESSVSGLHYLLHTGGWGPGIYCYGLFNKEDEKIYTGKFAIQ